MMMLMSRIMNNYIYQNHLDGDDVGVAQLVRELELELVFVEKRSGFESRSSQNFVNHHPLISIRVIVCRYGVVLRR